jgi:hypothetical protein
MELDKDKIKEMVSSELDEITDGFSVYCTVEEVNIEDPEDAYVIVRMPLHIVPEDNYIGLSFY